MKNDKLRFGIYGEMFLVDLENTMFFEADDHYTHVYLANGHKFLIPFGLSVVEGDVNSFTEAHPDAGYDFRRLGRKYIVNMDRVFHINSIKQNILLCDDKGTVSALQLSKPVLRELMENVGGS